MVFSVTLARRADPLEPCRRFRLHRCSGPGSCSRSSDAEGSGCASSTSRSPGATSSSPPVPDPARDRPARPRRRLGVVDALLHGEVLGVLDSAGLVIIGFAIIETSRFIAEEELLRQKELRSAVEARRSLTKFITIIVIAASLEALVMIFEASRTDSSAGDLSGGALRGRDVRADRARRSSSGCRAASPRRPTRRRSTRRTRSTTARPTSRKPSPGAALSTRRSVLGTVLRCSAPSTLPTTPRRGRTTTMRRSERRSRRC